MGPSLGEGDGSIIDVDSGEYYSWGFCNLMVNSRMGIGPSVLGGKTYFPEVKVR